MPKSFCSSWAITDGQKHALDSLVCERVSQNPAENDRILKSFTNKRVSGKDSVLGHLQDSGLKDDKGGETAVYLVKSEDGVGLLAFSLKCGELFQPYGRRLSLFKALKAEFFKAYMRINNKPQAIAEKAFNKLCSIQGLQREQFLDKKLRHDCITEKNKVIKRVNRTMSGIQLVDFCKNDSADVVWKDLSLDTYRTPGQILFWWFVAPIIFRVHELVGCEYSFLYAADLTSDRLLMTYYTDALNYHPEIKAGANKPRYDLYCSLMSQRINDMKQYHSEFQAIFNKPLDYDENEEG